MNAYQRKKNIAAVLALAAVLMAAPVCAQAMDTAPLVPGRQTEQDAGERLAAFGRKRGYKRVTASSKWLRQARLDGMMLNLRVFTPMGEEITFQEQLRAASCGDGAICLQIMASSTEPSIMLQLDQPAVDTLKKMNVTEIVVAGRDCLVRMRYLVSELDAVRAQLGLEDVEQLSVSGENDPITVVSEDGVRRQVTQ